MTLEDLVETLENIVVTLEDIVLTLEYVVVTHEDVVVTHEDVVVIHEDVVVTLEDIIVTLEDVVVILLIYEDVPYGSCCDSRRKTGFRRYWIFLHGGEMAPGDRYGGSLYSLRSHRPWL